MSFALGGRAQTVQGEEADPSTQNEWEYRIE